MKRDAVDARFSNQIRERDKWTCQRCWYFFPEGWRDGLDCAHMFGRAIPTTRFDPDNACALCRVCHGDLDTHPDLKRDFFRQRLGPERFNALDRRAHRAFPEGVMSEQT